ncbi:MAG: hypothetical protein PF508_09485 [Spirochaeta sp.]|jgi:hypothetical protein|nr:hypothetical protein [Spirochaeta sp.]
MKNCVFRRILALLIAAILLPAALVAEPTSDPNHPVYRALDRWQARGLVDQLPVMQPYPLSELETVLDTVIARGTVREREEAERFLAEITPRDPDKNLYGAPFTEARLFTRDDEIQPKGAIGVDFGGHLNETISIGGSAGGYAIERDAADLLPSGERATDDIVDDNAKVTIRGRDVYTLLQINSQTTFEWENLWIQAGIFRRSYGPFHDESPVISRFAPQSGNFILQYDLGPLRYTGTLSSHTATAVFKEIDEIDSAKNIDVNQDGFDDFENRTLQVPGKHLFIHSFGFQPTDWIELSIFEAVVFGPRLEPAYLVPLKFMWHAQGTAAFADNSLIGASMDLRPLPGVRIPVIVYVDDASFNDLASFDFDTKYKMATASAIQWAPDAGWEPMFEVSYETVFPYMYSHAGLDPYTPEANFNNYLHQGTSIGNGLLPNSDRARITAGIAPARWLELEVMGSLQRHGNASEKYLDQYLNDGGYYDNGREGEFFVYDDGNEPDDLDWTRGDLTYNDRFGFLTQEHIEWRYQTGLSGDIVAPVGRSTIRLGAGYTFEYIQNPLVYVWSETGGLNGGGGRTTTDDDEVNHYLEFELRYTY